MEYGVVAIAAGIIGFLGGLFSFRVKSRWCPACGSYTMSAATHLRDVECQTANDLAIAEQLRDAEREPGQ